MKKETEVFKLSYKFDSGLKYVASTGSVYIARNKVVIITLFLLLAYSYKSDNPDYDKENPERSEYENIQNPSDPRNNAEKTYNRQCRSKDIPDKALV